MKVRTLLMSLLLIGSFIVVVGNASQEAKADLYLWEDFDPVDPPTWNSTGLWHWVDEGGDPCIGTPSHPASSFSTPGSYGYHDDASCDYNVPPMTQNSGDLSSPSFDLSGTGTAWLHFYTFFDVEINNGPVFDWLDVQISPDNSAWTDVRSIENGALPPDPEGVWFRVDVDISGWTSDSTVWIRFHFDTIDGDANTFPGWYVDDVQIDDVPPPVSGMAIPYSEDFDSGSPTGWTWTSYWHQVLDPMAPGTDPCMNEAGAPTPPPYTGHPKRSFSSPGSMAYHIDPPNPTGYQDCTYDDGMWNNGWLKSPPIDFTAFSMGYLSFWFWLDAENTWETVEVSYSTDDSTYTVLDNLDDYFQGAGAYSYRYGTWNFYSYDLADPAIPGPGVMGNAMVWFRFDFDTGDEFGNDFAGWYIDDFVVSEIATIQSYYIGTQSPPVADGTYTLGEYLAPAMTNLPVGADHWDNLINIPGNLIGDNYLIVENDLDYLYIVYDVVGDTTNDPIPGDGAHISFDPENDDAWGPPSYDQDDEWGFDAFGAAPASPYHASNSTFMDPCGPPAMCGEGFGPSDQSAAPHRIYEFMIPLATLGFGTNPNLPWPLTQGYTIGFAGSAGPTNWNPGTRDLTSGNFDQWPINTGGPLNHPLFGDLIVGVPQVLANDYPLQETAPNDPSMSNPIDMLDLFQYKAELWDHSVVGIMQSTSAVGDNYDMVVYTNTTFGTQIADSTAPTDITDFVVLDKNTYASSENLGVVVGWQAGTTLDDYFIEMETDFDDYIITDSWTGFIESKTEGLEVLDAFELFVNADGLYDLSLKMESTVDLDMFLFDLSVLPTASRTGNPPIASSQTNGNGVSEYIDDVSLLGGIEYLLVLTNEDNGNGQYWVNPLNVTWTDLPPTSVNQWDVSVEMLGLQLHSPTGTTITDIFITDTGTGGPDVSAVTIYDDTNDNLMFNPGTDNLLGIGQISGGGAPINLPAPFVVPAGVTENLLVMYNIAPQAVAGNIVGAGVNAVDIVTGDGDPAYMTTSAATTPATVNAGAIPVINSEWQTTAPTADGTYGIGEHIITMGTNAFAMVPVAGNGFNALMIVENDGTDLYMTYDVIGDTTNDAGDTASFALDTDNDDTFTLGADDQFRAKPAEHYESDGVGGWNFLDACLTVGLDCADGFGTSPNSGSAHAIYEFKIPLSVLGVVPGDTMGFLSASDAAPGITDASAVPFDYDTWPQFLFGPPPLVEYADLVLATGPSIDALTVVGADLAPANVQQGDPDVEMERLTLTAGSGSVTVNSIQIDLSGSMAAADVALVEIWDDVNGNDVVDGPDGLLGSGTFAGLPPTVTIALGAGFTVTSGTPETLLVVFDIAGAAMAGDLVGVDIVDQTYVVVAAPDTVNPFGLIASTDSLIQAAVPDSLTVVGFDLAPANVNTGQLDVEMERLTLTAGSGSITVNSIKVDLSGSMVAADVALVEIWDDVNGNDIVDGPDAMLGSGSFAGIPPTVTITFGGGFTVTSGTPETLLVVYDISGAATPGNTVGVSIIDETYVVVAAPDTVNAFGPLASTDSLITGGPDALTVVGTDFAPANVMQGDPNVVMERLVLTAGSGSITVNTIQVDLAGTGGAADIALVEIWDDVNGNDVVDVGDVLLGSGILAGLPPTVTITLGAGFVVTAGTPESLLVVYDIAAGATAGATVGVSIVDQTYVVVAAPDTVNAFGPLASTNSLIQAAVPDSLTVAGADLAPATVNLGQLDVIMERLTLTAGSGAVTVNSIKVDLSGTGTAADITSVQIWDDVNSNDMLDGPDALLGFAAFAGGPPPTATITLGGGYMVVSGTPETLLVVYNIAAGATPGNTVGARIVDETYVIVVAPDTVNAFGPLQSTNSLILVPSDTLSVTGTGLTQLTAYPGETDVVLTGMRLSALSGSVTVTDIDIFTHGSTVDSDFAQVSLYDDTNDDSMITGVDTLLDTATIVNDRATFSGFSFTVTSGTDEHLMIAFDISSTATIGHIFGMVIMTNQNVTVSMPDTVSPMNFPLGTPYVEIIGGTITGTVEDEGGNPIAGANVQLINSTGVIVDVVATNTSGGFMFEDAYFGTYTLNASATDYEHNDSATATISLAAPSDNAGTIALTAVTTGEPPATEGDIEGNVYDKDGKPISGVKVELLDDQGNVVETATTNAQGHYSFDGLTFDTYSVRMSKSGLLNQTSGEFTLDANNPGMDFVNTMTTAPATTPAGEEVVPMWAWLLIVLFLILFVVFLLLWLMGRKREPDVVAPPKPLPPEMVEAEGATAPPGEAPGEAPVPSEPGAPPEPATPPEPETGPGVPPPPPPP